MATSYVNRIFPDERLLPALKTAHQYMPIYQQTLKDPEVHDIATNQKKECKL
jgi:mono/diheme cytochrome c family protein